jgi:hypothetical protein
VEEAYWDVVGPKIHNDRNKMRQELIAEQKKVPRSTSASSAIPASKTELSSEDALDAKLRAKFEQKGLL